MWVGDRFLRATDPAATQKMASCRFLISHDRGQEERSAP